ncbi:MAG: SUF system NifU family Fe-S cluster assembly protein [Candidatus Binatia bacterium]|nr:SUF system NifU family Fe-S cluster assembly protein [Candidatus Binatia bacterium]
MKVAPELRELYQEMIVDHGRRPRNFRRLENASCRAEGFNPLCGDRVTVYLACDNGTVRDAAFEGQGCAISMASASMMTEAIKGKSRAEVERMFEAFHRLLTEEEAVAAPELGKLEVFAGVREFPSRVKCAVLAWHTLKAALFGAKEPVSTE